MPLPLAARNSGKSRALTGRYKCPTASQAAVPQRGPDNIPCAASGRRVYYRPHTPHRTTR